MCYDFIMPLIPRNIGPGPRNVASPPTPPSRTSNVAYLPLRNVLSSLSSQVALLRVEAHANNATNGLARSGPTMQPIAYETVF